MSRHALSSCSRGKGSSRKSYTVDRRSSEPSSRSTGYEPSAKCWKHSLQSRPNALRELRYSSIVSSGANRAATLVPCHFRARVEPKTEPEVDNFRGTPANRRLSRQHPDVLCRKSWRQSALSGGMLPQNASASPTSLD